MGYNEGVITRKEAVKPMAQFKLVSPYDAAGDQPQAIEKLARGVELGLQE